jgi:hypothetical protein
MEALRLLVARPDEIAAQLAEALFGDPDLAAAYRAVVATPTLADAVASLGEGGSAAADVLQRIAVEETDAEVDDVLTRLVDEAAGRALAALQAEARVADDPLAVAGDVAWVKLRILELRDPATGLEARNLLLGWLTGRTEEER